MKTKIVSTIVALAILLLALPSILLLRSIAAAQLLSHLSPPPTPTQARP
jgi:hypothetical protein